MSRALPRARAHGSAPIPTDSSKLAAAMTKSPTDRGAREQRALAELDRLRVEEPSRYDEVMALLVQLVGGKRGCLVNGRTPGEAAERSFLAASIKRDVLWLARRDELQALDDTLVAIGFCSSGNDVGEGASSRCARAIIALVDVVPLCDLRDAAGTAAFGRAWVAGERLGDTRHACATAASDRVLELAARTAQQEARAS